MLPPRIPGLGLGVAGEEVGFEVGTSTGALDFREDFNSRLMLPWQPLAANSARLIAAIIDSFLRLGRGLGASVFGIERWCLIQETYRAAFEELKCLNFLVIVHSMVRTLKFGE